MNYKITRKLGDGGSKRNTRLFIFYISNNTKQSLLINTINTCVVYGEHKEMMTSVL